MAKNGRPKGGSAVDMTELEKLGMLQCTNAEVAAFFGISERAVELRMQNSKEFREAIEKGRALGRVSLRRKQMQAAEQGNPAMLIWLGKQLLGQRDVIAAEISGPQGGPVQIEASRAKEFIVEQIAQVSEKLIA